MCSTERLKHSACIRGRMMETGMLVALTSMGLGHPNISLNDIHLKKLDFQHFGSCFLDCIEKHILGISRNIGTYIFTARFIPFQPSSFAAVHCEALPRVFFYIRVWFTMSPCRDSDQMQTLSVAFFFYHLFCIIFPYCKFVLIH